MAKQQKTIKDAKGQEIPVYLLDKQIVATDALVRKVIALALVLSKLVQAANKKIMAIVMAYLEKTAEKYGQQWQGNAVLKSLDGKMQIEVDIRQIKSYDERLAVAGEKIRGWVEKNLATVTDPKQRKLFEQLAQVAKTALSLDHQGKVDHAKILQLRKYDFADQPEWQEAMDLIAASERITGTKRYLRFKQVDDQGKLVGIPVDFSAF
jgi:hypothetical protein